MVWVGWMMRDVFRGVSGALRCAAAVTLCLLGSAGAFADSYDAQAGYSTLNNPSGPWLYGYSLSVTGAVIPLPIHTYDPTGLDLWWRGLGGVSNYPAIIHNPLGYPIQFGQGGNSIVFPGRIAMRPAAAETNAVLRWVAPAAGSYTVAVSWLGISGDCGSTSSTTNVHLVINGAMVYLGITSGLGTSAAAGGTYNLAAGDTVDAVVGNGPDDNPNCDLIETTFTVTTGACLQACGAPPAGGTACPSAPWSVSFTACGDPSAGTITYQWRKGGVPIGGAAAQQSTYLIQHPGGADQGQYDCIATNNCTSVGSTPVTLSVFVADTNADGVVNTIDLGAVLGKFGVSVTPWSTGDLNGDGVVSTPDLGILLAQFGKSCP